MKELDTIQTQEKLNRVFAIDEKGNGGANHKYMVVMDRGLPEPKEVVIEFQNGPRAIEGSIEGVLDVDLLEIVRHRMQCFQAGPFASKYNEHALKHIEEALHCMNARVEDRIKRQVLGTNNK